MLQRVGMDFLLAHQRGPFLAASGPHLDTSGDFLMAMDNEGWHPQNPFRRLSSALIRPVPSGR